MLKQLSFTYDGYSPYKRITAKQSLLLGRCLHQPYAEGMESHPQTRRVFLEALMLGWHQMEWDCLEAFCSTALWECLPAKEGENRGLGMRAHQPKKQENTLTAERNPT